MAGFIESKIITIVYFFGALGSKMVIKIAKENYIFKGVFRHKDEDCLD